MSSSKERLDHLDGVRGLAVLLVLFAHAGWARMFYFIPNAGHLGIMLFFTLSGFLMAHLYIPGRLAWRYWLDYAIRRFFRIAPMFLAILLIGWLYNQSTMPPHIFQNFTTDRIIKQLLFTKLLWVPAWTVLVEVKFYTAFMLLALLLLALGRAIRHTYMPLLITTALWIVSMFVDGKGLLSLSRVIEYFLGGMVIAMLYARLPARYLNIRYVWDAVFILCAAIVVLSFIPGWARKITGESLDVWRHPYLYVPTMMGLILTALSSAGYAQKFLASRPMALTGRISYSVYLTNSFLFWFCGKKIFSGIAFWPKLWLTLATILFISWLCYRFIEKPGIRCGRYLSRRITS